MSTPKNRLSTEAASELRVEIPNVAPSFANMHLHWAEIAQKKRAWMESALVLTHKAMVEQGWPKATRLDEQRVVSFTLYRCWPPLDADNAVSSIKPILDGLRRAGAVWDDTTEHVRLPAVDQVRVRTRTQEKTVITVRGVD